MAENPPSEPQGEPQGELSLRTVALPRDANPNGDVFGGWTVSQMDLAAGSFSADRAQGRVATVSIDAMRFLRPVAVGDEVSCYCSLIETGETSLKVRIETWARTRGDKGQAKVTEGVFTFVAIEESGAKRPVPEAD